MLSSLPTDIPTGILDALNDIERSVRMGLFTANDSEDGLQPNTDVLMHLFVKRFAQFGFEDYIREGSFRMVLSHKDGWIIKIPIDIPRYGIENRIEYELFQLLPKKEQKWFPTTYMPIPSILLQERCDPDDYFYSLNTASIRIKAEDLGLGDVKEDNVGWRSGQYVFIDFQPCFYHIHNTPVRDNDVMSVAFSQLPDTLKEEYNYTLPNYERNV